MLTVVMLLVRLLRTCSAAHNVGFVPASQLRRAVVTANVHACRFMLNDLANVNRNITPWVVVNGHRPIYTTSSSGGSLASVTTVARDLRASIEDLLYTYEVCICLDMID